MKKIYLLLLACTALAASAQVPKIGNDTLLDIGCWNTEWFGNTENGPTNEALQYTNVKTVLKNTDVDVWGLCEISDATAYANLGTDLPQYETTIAAFSQTQKTALFWKKSKFTMLSSQLVLTGSQYSYEFASRPPLEVALQSKDSTQGDTIYFYVVHLKAYADAESYARRKSAAADLKIFLDANRRGQKVVVLGDWNDDIDQSTYQSSETPFKNLLDDTAHYYFTTKPLSDAGKASYTSIAGSLIDHQLISAPLRKFYLSNSCQILDMLPTYISNYRNTTSDHYPVVTFYNMNRYLKPPVDTTHHDTTHTGIAEAVAASFMVYPNPAMGMLNVRISVDASIQVVDMLGRTQALTFTHSGDTYTASLATLPEGLYFVQVSTAEGRLSKPLQVRR